MTVTLLFFPGCPDGKLTDVRLREKRSRAGWADVRVERRLVTTVEQLLAVRS